MRSTWQDALFSYLNSGNYDVSRRPLTPATPPAARSRSPPPPRPQFRYDLSKGLRPRRSVRTAMSHEILMYSIVQKE